jgi:TonB family protein
MLNRLLESKANRERSVSGAVASVATHSALIGLAIYATAQARVEAAPPGQFVRPFYYAPPRLPASSERGPRVSSNAIKARLVFVNPAVSIALPSIDVPLPTLGPGDFRRDPIGGSVSIGTGNPSPDGTPGTFRADQVEKQVSLIAESASARYPEVLRIAGVEGRVVARFVVDEEGRVEEGTVKLVVSDNPLFDEAVRSALARMRFAPAQIAGKKVQQLVEMPFVFALSR